MMAAQNGLVTRQQALEDLGLSAGAVDNLVARGRALSHETALALHEISDVNPARHHVTIPAPRRIRRADNDRYAVHTQRLEPRQVTWWHLMRIVTPTTAIEQCLEYGTPTYLLRQAIDRGARTGAVRRDDVARLTAALEARR